MPTHLDSDYPPERVEASYSGLLELVRTLAAFRDALVLVGGWVPFLLIRDHPQQESDFTHVGSADIDFAVDPDELDESEYHTIESLLRDRGWTQVKEEGALFRYHKELQVTVGRPPQDIVVDFLTAKDPQGGKHRHREVQTGLKARVAYGVPVGLAHKTSTQVSGTLPDGGGETTASVQLADVVGCVGMKALVLSNRRQEKDAYDVYTVIENYGSGPREVAQAFRPYREEDLLVEARGILAEKFSSESSEGARSVANFFTNETGDAKDRRAVRAFQTIRAFLEGID